MMEQIKPKLPLKKDDVLRYARHQLQRIEHLYIEKSPDFATEMKAIRAENDLLIADWSFVDQIAFNNYFNEFFEKHAQEMQASMESSIPSIQGVIQESRQTGFPIFLILLVLSVVVLGVVWLIFSANDESLEQSPIKTEASMSEIRPESHVTSTGLENVTQHMSFAACNASVEQMLIDLAGSSYKSWSIVDTIDVKVTRICTNDGSLLVTCSSIDEKMVITKSPSRNEC